jgi:hypothetical protein
VEKSEGCDHLDRAILGGYKIRNVWEVIILKCGCTINQTTSGSATKVISKPELEDHPFK